jgi:DNA repair protein SbcC/Rad50
MQTALRRNRSTIEAIFGRIHSPPDSSGRGEQLGTLVRKLDGTEASLSQISTAQRSAFALSIFLAQNSQLRTATPMLVIDDPIAHFNDLNSLSFLDYLREIVLAWGRQVFSATANHKLAELFSRKFDFLGIEEFCRIELQR